MTKNAGRSAETSMTVRPVRPGEAAVRSDLALRSKVSNGYDDAFMAACVEELTITEAMIAAGGVYVAESAEGGIAGRMLPRMEKAL